MSPNPEPFVTESPLRGQVVTLLPLTDAHVEPLQHAIRDGDLWTIAYASVPHPDQVPAYVGKAVRAMQAGTQRAYVVQHHASGRIVGCTRLYEIDADHRRCKLGYTFYAASVQRTAVNTECKLLLLQQAFEYMQQIAVEFRTHHDNLRSQRAIERLGAHRDGMLRNHMILADGSIRHSVCYSILDREWPGVRQQLTARLAPS